MQPRPLNPKLKIETISSAWWPQQLFTTIGQNSWQQWQQWAQQLATGADLKKQTQSYCSALGGSKDKVLCGFMSLYLYLCHFMSLYLYLCHYIFNNV